jgi:serine/threonine protein kinase/Tfp pilus assembly protein PilF
MNPHMAPADGSGPDLSSEQASQVVRILEDYLAELEQGGQPHPDALIARHPEHAEALRTYLEKLDLLHQAATGLRGSMPAREAVPACLASPPERLGDFRIRREVGRGGMGIVYEAEQTSLGRRVALKVLPSAAALDPRQLQRFKHEAQAAAQLHHPHIVPVFGVGCDGGVHYFAMQFIDGQTLATQIEERRQRAGLDTTDRSAPEAVTPRRSSAATPGSEGPAGEASPPQPALPPSPSGHGPGHGERRPAAAEHFRTIARLGVQAAEALEHAHQLGIIHRDIKPANLLLDDHDNLWVTDFGLAQFRAGVELTQSGDLVGTLRYMSPEQALAKRGLVDQRTDVYSLGATLYELATLEPIFAGRDREELLRQIAFEEPRPPRRVNRAVPADLETILLKATAKEPAGRYATAQELADDLRRFLRHEPIQARRPTPLQRAAKFARRHQAVLGATLAVALLGLAASTFVFWRGKTQTEALQRQTEEQRKAARDAADAMYTHLVKWLHDEPQVDKDQKELLKKALHFHEQFAKEAGPDPESRYHAALAAHRVAEIHLWLARWPPQESIQHLRGAEGPANQAIALLERLTAEHPDKFTYEQQLAECQMTLGQVLQATGRGGPAEQTFLRARARLDHLARVFKDSPAYRASLALCQHKLGAALVDAGPPRWQQADEPYRKAQALFRELVAKFPKEPDYARHLADVYAARGQLLNMLDQPREAEGLFREAIALLRVQAEDPRCPADYRHALGLAHYNLGTALEKTVQTDPLPLCGLPDDRAQLALGCYGLLMQAARLHAAETAYTQGRRLYENLVATSPQVARYQGYLALNLHSLAHLHHRRGDLGRARNLAELAVRHQRAALQTSPENVTYSLSLQRHYQKLGEILVALGEYRQAARAADNLANVVSRCPIGGSEAMEILARCAPLAARDPGLSPAERQKRAETYAHQAAVLARQVAETTHELPFTDLQNNVAWYLITCPDAHDRDPKRAVTLAENLVARLPGNATYWNTLGLAYYRKGDYKSAVRALEKAIDLGHGEESLDWLFLAMAQWQMGHKDQARASLGRALRGKSTSEAEEVRRFQAEAAALFGQQANADPDEDTGAQG